MSKIALIYSFNTRNTKKIAELIKEAIGEAKIDEINAETVSEIEFNTHENFILGVPTWFDGELPNYWDEFIPALEDIKLKGKTFALFGLGDQLGYPENFVDAMGTMAQVLENKGAKIEGLTSSEGYRFEKSKAIRNGQFLGLAIDIENQSNLIDKKIKAWVEALSKIFVL
jgi:flavodoxin I